MDERRGTGTRETGAWRVLSHESILPRAGNSDFRNRDDLAVVGPNLFGCDGRHALVDQLGDRAGIETIPSPRRAWTLVPFDAASWDRGALSLRVSPAWSTKSFPQNAHHLRAVPTRVRFVPSAA